MSLSTNAVPVRRSLQALLLALTLLLMGCGDTSNSPEDPRILGFPPQVAYLGVDYNYNFGAVGGDNLLNYSLVNNPSWLALEATTNKARKGIVLRGVPGITGGREGEDDLGQYDSIRIATNDGNLIGDSEFSVEVRHNPLEVVSGTVTEGEPYEPEVSKDSDEVCEVPDMSVSPGVTVHHEKLVSENTKVTAPSDYGSGSKDYQTYRALVRVDLGQPSVEPVSVRFRIQGQEPCSAEDEEELPCEYEGGNQNRAIYKEDLILDGNNAYGSGFPEPPEYLEYLSEDDDGGTGLLHFEAGQTTCFIPVWVHDDRFAENTESFEVELQEVTEGIASLNDNGAVRTRSIQIEDNTPTAGFETESITVSENGGREVTATLNRSNDTGETLYAAVEVVEVTDGPSWQVDLCPEQGSTDCVTASKTTNNDSLVIAFDPGSDETTFYVQASTSSDAPLKEEIMRELQFDQSFQYGREFAAATTDSTVETYINEWPDDVTQSELGFSVDSLVAGALGEVYVAGVDSSSAIRLQSINRLGNPDVSGGTQSDVVALGENSGVDSGGWPQTSDAIQLAFAGENTGTTGSPQVTRYLGVAYPTASDKGMVKLFRSTISTGDSDNDGNDETVRSEEAEEFLWQMNPVADGVWDQKVLDVNQDGTLYAGALDNDSVRVTRIDTGEEGDPAEPVADPAWTENLEATDPLLNGLFDTDTAGIVALGSDKGAVDPGTNIGGEDFYLFSRNADGGAVNERVQFGTEGDDRADLAGADGNRFWLAGNQGGPYQEDGSGDFEEDTDGSAGPFLIVVNSNGNVQGAIHPDIPEDQNWQVSNIQALAVSGNDAFIAGQTGDDRAYLMGLRYTGSQSGDEPSIEQRWSGIVDGANGIVDMDNYRDRKLYLVLETDAGQMIRPYDQVGNPLTQ
ncbi:MULTISPECIES: hypothetical protein [Halomonadaceae]|uniref:Uncharacterized protein n=1 Tax=Vreelandella halophila TaxID=86177 RepID=A0A9X5B5C9_9GAMM|nr:MULTISPECIES: hypothetical protein [Halomonas]MYL27461.1 hypothetical protein [Halomonas utahensis]MYL74587.1 hypothetical protein [Halomonas sp. 22501_18_FS]